jgi:hypothetical protein
VKPEGTPGDGRCGSSWKTLEDVWEALSTSNPGSACSVVGSCPGSGAGLDAASAISVWNDLSEVAILPGIFSLALNRT